MTIEINAAADRPPVEAWQAQGLYPFANEAASAVELLERQLFDQVAWHLSRHHPAFGSLRPEAMALQFRLLRQAVECGPEELQGLLTEVLDLPPAERQLMSELLKDVSLASVIRESHVVTERLRLLDGLETLVFDAGLQMHVRERGELHPIVARNAWLFGEEFALSVDNRSLTEVLRKHRELLALDIAIGERPEDAFAAEGPGGKRRFVDLMFSRATRRHQPGTLEHLVVELKAPRVAIDEDEVAQIFRYASRVAHDERFRAVGARWSFWLIGREIDDNVRALADMQNRMQLQHGFNHAVRVVSWAQVIDENRARLQFLQETLDHRASRQAGLRHLQRRYPECLSDMVMRARERQARYAGR